MYPTGQSDVEGEAKYTNQTSGIYQSSIYFIYIIYVDLLIYINLSFVGLSEGIIKQLRDTKIEGLIGTQDF